MQLTTAFKNKCKKFVKETVVTLDAEEGKGGQCISQSFLGVAKVTLKLWDLKKSPIGTIRSASESTTFSVGNRAFEQNCARLHNWTNSARD